MTKKDIDNIISIICPNDEDFEKPIISPAYLKNELEALALTQEPCEDEYIKVPKKALKYRTAGMVAYNAEWLKNHFDIERAVICGAQEPCDAVDREAVLDLCDSKDPDYKVIHFKEDVECLPPVTPQPKIGHWIFCEGIKGKDNVERCSCCQSHWKEAVIYSSDTQEYLRLRLKYCPNCGAKMQEMEE